MRILKGTKFSFKLAKKVFCRKRTNRLVNRSCLLAVIISLTSVSALFAKQDRSTHHKAFLPTQVHAISTIPPNGDLNPYGVAFVPAQFPHNGTAQPGDILVSNFNNQNNLQGTGSTIVDIPANGSAMSVFFQGNGSMGLTTALNVLKNGLVLVGNFPSSDGSCQNASNGSILVINSQGQLIQTIVDNNYINGPWDSTIVDQGDKAKLFIANALTGTIVRLDLSVSTSGVTIDDKNIIAAGYQHQCDPVTFVDAPTGLVYDVKHDLLYVSSTKDNAIFAVPNAGFATHTTVRGFLVFTSQTYLHGPLAMMMAPNGHLIVSNNDAINLAPKHASALTEFIPYMGFVKEITVDSMPGGAFGLNVGKFDHQIRFAAVDDNQNLLLVWTLPEEEHKAKEKNIK